MAFLTGALTALTLAGTPGLPAWTDTTAPSDTGTPRPYARTFTRLSAAGTPGRLSTFGTKDTGAGASRVYSAPFSRLAPSATPTAPYGSFAGKAEKIEDIKWVTDRYVAVVTFASVDAVDIDITDKYVPVLNMGAVAGVARPTTDRYVPRVTMTVAGLQKASVSNTPSVSDTYVPVTTFQVIQREIFSVTDTYVPVLTFTPSVATADVVTPTDTYVPVLGMEYLLDTVIGALSFPLTDRYVPVLAMNAAASAAGEVDMIHVYERPYGLIRINEI